MSIRRSRKDHRLPRAQVLNPTAMESPVESPAAISAAVCAGTGSEKPTAGGVTLFDRRDLGGAPSHAVKLGGEHRAQTLSFHDPTST